VVGPEGRGGQQVWWLVDKAVTSWVMTHPSTIEQVARKFFQGRYHAAARTLRRLRKRKRARIPYLNVLHADRDGRPQYQYAGYDVGNADEHEYLLTEFAIALPGGDWVRGPKVGKRRPDGEWNPGVFCNVEMDTGRESEAQFRDRMDSYRGCQDPLLIVVHNADSPDQTAKRVMRLMAWGEAVDRIALYVSLDEIRRKGWDAQWADGGGKAISLKTILQRRP